MRRNRYQGERQSYETPYPGQPDDLDHFDGRETGPGAGTGPGIEPGCGAMAASLTGAAAASIGSSVRIASASPSSFSMG